MHDWLTAIDRDASLCKRYSLADIEVDHPVLVTKSFATDDD